MLICVCICVCTLLVVIGSCKHRRVRSHVVKEWELAWNLFERKCIICNVYNIYNVQHAIYNIQQQYEIGTTMYTTQSLRKYGLMKYGKMNSKKVVEDNYKTFSLWRAIKGNWNEEHEISALAPANSIMLLSVLCHNTPIAFISSFLLFDFWGKVFSIFYHFSFGREMFLFFFF